MKIQGSGYAQQGAEQGCFLWKGISASGMPGKRGQEDRPVHRVDDLIVDLVLLAGLWDQFTASEVTRNGLLLDLPLASLELGLLPGDSLPAYLHSGS